MPERRDHLRVGFEVVREGGRGEADYTDVIVHTPGSTPDTIEEGEYYVRESGRGTRTVELRSGEFIKKYLALGQPGLGRFRFISTDEPAAAGYAAAGSPPAAQT